MTKPVLSNGQHRSAFQSYYLSNIAYKKLFFDGFCVLIHSAVLSSVQHGVIKAKLTFPVVDRREMSSSSQSRSLLDKLNFFSLSVKFDGYSLLGNGRKFRGCLPICFALAGFFSVARGWWRWARERERKREGESCARERSNAR